MTACLSAGIGSTVAIIMGGIIGATTGQWWWTDALLGIFIGIGWQLGKDAEKRSSE